MAVSCGFWHRDMNQACLGSSHGGSIRSLVCMCVSFFFKYNIILWRNDGVHCLVLKLLLTSTFNPVFHIHLSVGEPFYVSVSLPSISRSVSVCKLQRQHHMATDSFHTFPLCSIKLLNPCQSLRAERERAW